MPENRDAEVDPRFDPLFQRGYDPKLHGGRRPRPAARHATEPVPIASIRDSAGDDDRSPAEAVVPPLDSPSDADAPILESEPAERGRNPFRLALLIVSIVSAAGSAVLLWRRFQEDPYGGSGYSQTSADLFFYNFVDSLMQPLLTGAIVGFCLWLVLWAIRPRRGS